VHHGKNRPPMSHKGQYLPESDVCVTSVQPPITDSSRTSRHFAFGPFSEGAHRQMSPGDEINFGYVSGSIRILNLPLFAVFVAAARFPAAQG
jgi:hypothetical protein